MFRIWIDDYLPYSTTHLLIPESHTQLRHFTTVYSHLALPVIFLQLLFSSDPYLMDEESNCESTESSRACLTILETYKLHPRYTDSTETQ